jgi:hypothetical protein
MIPGCGVILRVIRRLLSKPRRSTDPVTGDKRKTASRLHPALSPIAPCDARETPYSTGIDTVAATGWTNVICGRSVDYAPFHQKRREFDPGGVKDGKRRPLGRLLSDLIGRISSGRSIR